MSSEIPISETPRIELILSQKASARLERARAEAEKLFNEGVRNLFPSGHSDSTKKADVEVLLFQYVHAVWVAFAEEALNSASTTWVVRKHIEMYLHVLISKAFREKHPSAGNVDFQEELQGFGSATRSFLKLKTSIWDEVQQALIERADIELATLEAKPDPIPAAADPGTTSAQSRRAQAPPDPSESQQPKGNSAVFVHSADFSSIVFQGRPYNLTKTQRLVVEELFRNWEQGTPEVSQEYLLEHVIGAERSRLVDTFRDSPLWNTLIVKGKTRGTVKLSLPDKTS